MDIPLSRLVPTRSRSLCLFESYEYTRKAMNESIKPNESVYTLYDENLSRVPRCLRSGTLSSTSTSTVLHCTALYSYCTVLYCTVLNCTALHLHCTELHCTAPALHCTALYCPALHYHGTNRIGAARPPRSGGEKTETKPSTVSDQK